MTVEQIRATILRVLSEVAPNADVSDVNPNVSFHDQFEIDSIDFDFPTR